MAGCFCHLSGGEVSGGVERGRLLPPLLWEGGEEWSGAQQAAAAFLGGDDEWQGRAWWVTPTVFLGGVSSRVWRAAAAAAFLRGGG